MNSIKKNSPKISHVWAGIIEVGFIIFLFYANLLMGEFTHSNGQGKSLVMALKNIVSLPNFTIAIVAGLIGYILFEFFRKKL